MAVTTDQFETIAALLSLGCSVAMERGALSVEDAQKVWFSPNTMHRLARAGATAQVTDLVHAGLELGTISRQLPQALSETHAELQAAALACLSERAGSDASNWLANLDVGNMVPCVWGPAELRRGIESPDIDLAVACVFTVAESREVTLAHLLRSTLLTTTSDELRDACALALSDLEDEELPALIEGLLQQPRTRGQRARLVYALGPYDNRGRFSLLVDLALCECEETLRRTIDIIGVLDPGVASEEVAVATQRIEQCRTSMEEGSRRALLGELLELVMELGRADLR